METRPARAPRPLDTAALAVLASYAATWTVLLDESSRIVHELGTRDLLFGGEPQTSSIGRRIAAFVDPEQMGVAMDRMEESLAESGSDIDFEISAGEDGRYRPVRVRAVNRFDDEALRGVILAISPA